MPSTEEHQWSKERIKAEMDDAAKKAKTASYGAFFLLVIGVMELFVFFVGIKLWWGVVIALVFLAAGIWCLRIYLSNSRRRNELKKRL